MHGKLANGLSLENRIRPVFVGRGFGNYDDRRSRDDIRYVLTYISPTIGFEGPVIRDVLDAYPRRVIVLSVPVAETGSGADRAALLDKFGAAPVAMTARYLLSLVLSPFLFTRGLEDQALPAKHPRPCVSAAHSPRS